MKHNENRFYTFPEVLVVVCEVEQGFAATGGDALNYGQDGGAGGTVPSDDVVWGGDY